MSDNIDISEIKKIVDDLQCEYCNSIFKTKSNLKLHQNTAKYCIKIRLNTLSKNTEKEQENLEKYECDYCLKKFSRKSQLNSHQNNCNNKIIEKKIADYKGIILLKNEKILYLENTLEKLENDFKERETKYEDRITELESHLADIALKASTKPTTSTTNNTKIKTLNQLQPINFEEIKEKSSELTIEHIKRGIEGYIDHITPQLEGKISCPDVSRKIIKYKNSDNQIITDLEGAVITKKICGAIKDTNNDLIKQYSNEMYEKMQTSDLEGKYDETAKLLNEGSKVLDAAIQVNTASKGEKTELGDNIVKQMCLLGSKII